MVGELMQTKPTHRRVLGNNSGLTLVEVILAMVVLGIVSVMLLRFLSFGETVRGRGLRIDAASVLARNEAERVKAQAANCVAVEDTFYETSGYDLYFWVSRETVTGDDYWEEEDTTAIQEVAIKVGMLDNPEHLVEFRLLQGCLP